MNTPTVIGAIIAVAALLLVVGGGVIAYNQGLFSKDSVAQSGVGTTTTQTVANQVAEATKSGSVARLGISVRDMANTNQNTKVVLPVYCQDSKGNFILDGVSSSTSADISATTTVKEAVTCWAFNATYQTKTPLVINVTEEAMTGKVIDAYRVSSQTGHLQFYTDTFATGNAGVVNVSAPGTNGAGTFSKARYTVNVSNQFMPLGGIYFNTVPGSNISDIDLSGAAIIYGGDHASSNLKKSSLGTNVNSRKENWNYVFEFDDNSATSNNDVLLLEQNDYVETGSVKVKSSSGCTGVTDLISSYAFTKGYFRSSIDNQVKYGHETDATPAAVITTDITGDTAYCTA